MDLDYCTCSQEEKVIQHNIIAALQEENDKLREKLRKISVYAVAVLGCSKGC